MSETTYKNLVRRREHYERHQPAAREHLGLLEKHKDYAQRARNFHEKEKRLAKLKEKAANRNPDEYNHGMVNARTKNGVHIAESTRKHLSIEELKLLKTQDRKYILMKKSAEDNKVANLKAQLHGTKATRINNHVKFDSDSSAVDTKSNNDPNDWDDDDENVKKRKRQLLDEMSTVEESVEDKKIVRKIAKKSKIVYKQLEQHEQRAEKLGKLLRQFDLEKAMLQKGRRVKIADATDTSPAVFMWKPERKR